MRISDWSSDVCSSDLALHHMHHDVAAESSGGGLAEGDVRGDRPVEVLFDNSCQPFLDMVLQGGTGVDLMSRDANIHWSKISFFPTWALRSRTSTGPQR